MSSPCHRPGLPNGTQSTAYSQTVTASGGTGPYTFAITSGSLPAGLSLSSGGVISGTPTGSGVSSFTVGATDSVGNTGARAYTVNIGTVSLTVSPASLPAGSQNVAYSQTVTASGGTGPYTFAIVLGRAAGRTDAQQRRRDQRHADRERGLRVHRAGDRYARQYRHARLCGEYRHRLAHHQSGEPAAGDRRTRL